MNKPREELKVIMNRIAERTKDYQKSINDMWESYFQCMDIINKYYPDHLQPIE